MFSVSSFSDIFKQNEGINPNTATVCHISHTHTQTHTHTHTHTHTQTQTLTDTNTHTVHVGRTRRDRMASQGCYFPMAQIQKYTCKQLHITNTDVLELLSLSLSLPPSL